MKKRIPLLRLNYTKSEKQFILEGVQEILGSGFLTMSKKIRHFEELFAKFVKVKYKFNHDETQIQTCHHGVTF